MEGGRRTVGRGGGCQAPPKRGPPAREAGHGGDPRAGSAGAVEPTKERAVEPTERRGDVAPERKRGHGNKESSGWLNESVSMDTRGWGETHRGREQWVP